MAQTHLTWPGQAELSNISDRQNTAIASSNENKRIPHRNAAPAHNAPTLPATLLPRLNVLKPNDIYRVSQEERTKLREGVPYVKLYRYNPKHLYPKLNGYGDNGMRSLKL